MTTLISAFIFSFSVSAANQKSISIEGTFVKVERGDYMHLVLKGKDGERISLVCSDLPKSLVKGIDCNDLEIKPNNYKDKVLTVVYHEETKHIPEAQETITWKYVDRIDLKK